MTDTKPRRLIAKVLTYEVFQWDRASKKRGPILASCIGWEAVDAFLRLQGTALVRITYSDIPVIQFPPGWDGLCVNMENVYADE